MGIFAKKKKTRRTFAGKKRPYYCLYWHHLILSPPVLWQTFWTIQHTWRIFRSWPYNKRLVKRHPWDGALKKNLVENIRRVRHLSHCILMVNVTTGRGKYGRSSKRFLYLVQRSIGVNSLHIWYWRTNLVEKFIISFEHALITIHSIMFVLELYWTHIHTHTVKNVWPGFSWGRELKEKGIARPSWNLNHLGWRTRKQPLDSFLSTNSKFSWKNESISVFLKLVLVIFFSISISVKTCMFFCVP